MYITEHGNEEAEEEIREGFKNVPCSLWYTLLMLSGMCLVDQTPTGENMVPGFATAPTPHA